MSEVSVKQKNNNFGRAAGVVTLTRVQTANPKITNPQINSSVREKHVLLKTVGFSGLGLTTSRSTISLMRELKWQMTGLASLAAC